MQLSGLLTELNGVPAYRRLLAELRRSGTVKGLVVLDAAKPYLVARLWEELKGPMLLVTPRPDSAFRWEEQLRTWCGPDVPLHLFPEPARLPYERLAPDPAASQQRLRLLSLLAQPGEEEGMAPLIVASALALAFPIVAPKAFISHCHTLRRGERLALAKLLEGWLNLGYKAVEMVEAPGQFSRRGGIVDVFSPSADLPTRIELLGDEIESLRLFDPDTQRSLRLVEEVLVAPATELPPDLASADGNTGRGSSAGSLLDYLPEGGLVVFDEPELSEAALAELAERAEEVRASREEGGGLISDLPQPYFTWEELVAKGKEGLGRLRLASWLGAEAASASHLDCFAAAPAYGGRLRSLLSEVKEALGRGERVVLVSQQARRLSELFKAEGVAAAPLRELTRVPSPGALALVEGSLAGGWRLSPGAAAPLVLLSDAEIFGFVKERRPLRRRAAPREEGLEGLSPGDYVVHVEHGIARFGGFKRMAVDGVERDYLLLEYAAGDKLYVPTDQVDRVGRYIGPGDHTPALSRLGTQEWTRLKERVRRSVGEVARELLQLYSAREVVPGFAFSADTLWQQELEASFPYVETPDQLQALREVKADMERPRPTDRLVLGDVGYGKTEVAVRAAFKAVMDGRQVAVLVPTTVLAQQHFNTFRQRLAAFPLRVEVLSRFRSEAEQREIVAALKAGAIDICIGTHRLLQKDVAFKDLGLLIIDEEQRFGVVQKEHLKRMRQEVDVLTLSATPIPRTLHMSLVGVRDMSVMETAPEERLPIVTYVAQHDDRLVREAILRELERGGQVFYVHNRVQSIEVEAQRLRRLVPEAEIVVGHGQMPEEHLERVMLDFAAGRSDVLVCTTIIESGLDMPNVNTIIINRADRFGLAQLYQLRGRVGRGAFRAYAYLLYDRDSRLRPAAAKRLQAIFEATELGAGFRIAMRDLEIRGAGNLLGTEQSGHIAAVGFDLYSRLLAEAVEEVKVREGRAEPKPRRLPTPTINLPISAHLPEDYVAAMGARLSFYHRMAAAETLDQVTELAEELLDRFGPPPRPVRGLLYRLRLRILARRAAVESVVIEEGQVVVRMRAGALIPHREALERLKLPALRIGRTQVRLGMGRGWQERLVRVLEAMAGDILEQACQQAHK